MNKFLYSLLLICPLTLMGQVFKWEEPKARTTPPPAQVEVEKSGSNLYTIQLGTFYEPTLKEFQAIQGLGPIYCVKNEDQSYQVFMGAFAAGEQLEKALQQIQAKGYTAYTQSLPAKASQEVVVIQLLSTKKGNGLAWEKLDQIGNLYGLLEQAQVFKLVTGPFANKSVAAAQLSTLRASGFKDAFVKTVKLQLLSPIGYFEKGLTPTSFTTDLADEIDRIAQVESPVIYERETSLPATTATSTTRSTTEVPFEKTYLPVPKTALPVPPINARVKRTSALDLQKILKSEKHYGGSFRIAVLN